MGREREMERERERYGERECVWEKERNTLRKEKQRQKNTNEYYIASAGKIGTMRDREWKSLRSEEYERDIQRIIEYQRKYQKTKKLKARGKKEIENLIYKKKKKRFIGVKRK